MLEHEIKFAPGPWFQVPDLVPKQVQLAAVLLVAHKTAVALLAILIVWHVSGALVHAFAYRDGIMQRMLPRRRGA